VPPDAPTRSAGAALGPAPRPAAVPGAARGRDARRKAGPLVAAALGLLLLAGLLALRRLQHRSSGAAPPSLAGPHAAGAQQMARPAPAPPQGRRTAPPAGGRARGSAWRCSRRRSRGLRTASTPAKRRSCSSTRRASLARSPRRRPSRPRSRAAKGLKHRPGRAQGLLLEFGFNQAEALAAFDLAAAADPGAAMPHWGRAYALGPGANRRARARARAEICRCPTLHLPCTKPYAHGRARARRAVVEQATSFPAFGVEHFADAAAAAGRAAELARAAAAGGHPLAARELAYAEAAKARFPPGSERQPARHAAERAYAEGMRAAGAPRGALQAPAACARGPARPTPPPPLECCSPETRA